MFLDGDATAGDETETFGDTGVRVVIDASSARLLDDARLEYDAGLIAKEFSFTNPNATRSYVYGQSFS